MHFALQIEIGRFVLNAGFTEDSSESDEDEFSGPSSLEAIESYPEDEIVAERPVEHELPIGFHVREAMLGDEDE